MQVDGLPKFVAKLAESQGHKNIVCLIDQVRGREATSQAHAASSACNHNLDYGSSYSPPNRLPIASQSPPIAS